MKTFRENSEAWTRNPGNFGLATEFLKGFHGDGPEDDEY